MGDDVVLRSPALLAVFVHKRLVVGYFDFVFADHEIVNAVVLLLVLTRPVVVKVMSFDALADKQGGNALHVFVHLQRVNLPVDVRRRAGEFASEVNHDVFGNI